MAFLSFPSCVFTINAFSSWNFKLLGRYVIFQCIYTTQHSTRQFFVPLNWSTLSKNIPRTQMQFELNFFLFLFCKLFFFFNVWQTHWKICCCLEIYQFICFISVWQSVYQALSGWLPLTQWHACLTLGKYVLTFHKIRARFNSPHNLSFLCASHSTIFGIPEIGWRVLICKRKEKKIVT